MHNRMPQWRGGTPVPAVMLLFISLVLVGLALTASREPDGGIQPADRAKTAAIAASWTANELTNDLPDRLSLLMRTEATTQPSFICPSSDFTPEYLGGGTNTPLGHFDFGTALQNLTYVEANPYPDSISYVTRDSEKWSGVDVEDGPATRR